MKSNILKYKLDLTSLILWRRGLRIVELAGYYQPEKVRCAYDGHNVQTNQKKIIKKQKFFQIILDLWSLV